MWNPAADTVDPGADFSVIVTFSVDGLKIVAGVIKSMYVFVLKIFIWIVIVYLFTVKESIGAVIRQIICNFPTEK